MTCQVLISTCFLLAILSSCFAAKSTKETRARDHEREGIFRTTEEDVLRIEEGLSRQYQTDSGKRVLFSDNFLEEEVIHEAWGALQSHSWWAFQQASFNGSDKVVGGDGIPWGSQYSSDLLLAFPLGQELQKMAHYLAGDLEKVSEEDTTEEDDREDDSTRSVVKKNVQPFLPYDVRMKVIRRGDLTTMHRGTAEESGEVWMAIFMTEVWKNNLYGDFFIYDDEDEIMAGANPSFGRLIAWNATLGYLVRPPCIEFSRGEDVLMIRWTRDAEKVERHETARKQEHDETQEGITNGFALSGETAPTLDIAKHEVLDVEASIGKKVHVFDGLFEEDDLRELRKYIVRHGVVFYDDSDDGGTSDNVQWISGFEVSHFVQTKYWQIVKQVASYVSKGEGDWYPYDVSCNIIRSYDHTRVHGDVRNGIDDEWTFLLYLSDMKTGDYGETAFFSKNSDKTEMEYQVRAEYGRVAIFEGQIPHAARPPSLGFVGPRYSFAVKMAKTPFRAISHVLHEKYSQNEFWMMQLSSPETDQEPDVEWFVEKSKRAAKGNVEKLNKTLNTYMRKIDKGKKKKQRLLFGKL